MVEHDLIYHLGEIRNVGLIITIIDLYIFTVLYVHYVGLSTFTIQLDCIGCCLYPSAISLDNYSLYLIKMTISLFNTVTSIIGKTSI